jgi:hypothetical protein
MDSSNVVQLEPRRGRRTVIRTYLEKLTPAMKRGGLLAVDLLEELCDPSNESLCVITDEWRSCGTQQKNLVAEYIHRLTSPEEVIGFGRILTEALVMEAHGNIPCLAYLECAAVHPAQDLFCAWDAEVGNG